MIEPGLTARITFTADDASTASALGSGDVPVLGTPKVVALCEEAACAAISGTLPAGATTVGTHIAVDHLAPTAVGRTVTASATLTQVDQRKLVFALTVTEGDTAVARGSHTRFVVDRASFLASVAPGVDG